MRKIKQNQVLRFNLLSNIGMGKSLISWTLSMPWLLVPACLNIHEIADIMGFSHRTISRVYTEWKRKTNNIRWAKVCRLRSQKNVQTGLSCQDVYSNSNNHFLISLFWKCNNSRRTQQVSLLSDKNKTLMLWWSRAGSFFLYTVQFQ